MYNISLVCTFHSEFGKCNSDELYKIISHHSGQTFERVYKDSERDYWMIADEAKAYGMIDEVLVRG